MVSTCRLAVDWYTNTCPDDNCSVNGGIGVDINNDGCLTEAGRGSVYIPNYFGGGGDRCLVTTRIAGDCHCQTGSFDVVTSGHCLILNKEVQSYRFIHVSA